MKIIIILAILVVTGGLFFWFFSDKGSQTQVEDFLSCKGAGYPVMESYPRQCRTSDGRTFVEDIGNTLEKLDLIRVTFPQPNSEIQSPLSITGEARGYWFFEASFPIKLYDANGNLLATGIAQAKSDWMVTDFVPFEAEITFIKPSTKNGTIIFEKDNPSGLPEHADELRFPIIFSTTSNNY